MNKDSLEMTASDRERVLEAVRQALQEPGAVVITHGTDTMVETGLLLKRELPDLPVPIVLTGAMTPLGFEGSDGLQNLTESLIAVRLLRPGVYVVMHKPGFSNRSSPQRPGTGTICLEINKGDPVAPPRYCGWL
jgi:L-asparaginase